MTTVREDVSQVRSTLVYAMIDRRMTGRDGQMFADALDALDRLTARLESLDAGRYDDVLAALDRLTVIVGKHSWQSHPAPLSMKRQIERECDDRGLAQPAYEGLTQGEAVTILEQLAAGTYDVGRWVVPF